MAMSAHHPNFTRRCATLLGRLALVLTILPAAASATPPPSRAQPTWGVNGHPLTAYPGVSFDEQLELVRSLGLTSYRVNISDASRLHALIGMAHAARAKGVDLLPVITPALDLAATSAEELYRRSYELAVALVTPLKHLVRVWELGNELENFAILKACEMREDGSRYDCAWGPAGGVGVLDYHPGRWKKVSAVLKGLSDGVVSVDPTIRKAIGTAGWGHLGAFERMRRDGIAWDISVWHIYGEDPEWALKTLSGFGRPIWITELNHPHGSTESEQAQADGLQRMMKRLQALSATYRIEAVHIYELLDEPYWFPSSEGAMGLYKLDKLPPVAGAGTGSIWRLGAAKRAAQVVRDVAGPPRPLATASDGTNAPPARSAIQLLYAERETVRDPAPASAVPRRCDLDEIAAIGTLPPKSVAIAYVYCLVLGRAPDGAGRGAWLAELDRGMSLTDIVVAMVQSGEFASLYQTAKLDAAEHARLIHWLLLGRLPAGSTKAPPAAVLADILAAPVLYRTHSILDPAKAREDLLQRQRAACLSSARAARPQGVVRSIQHAYCVLLARPPAIGELKGWRAALGWRAGPDALFAALVASDEFREQLPATGDPEPFIAAMYRLILGRDPDGGGLSDYRRQITSGEVTRTALVAALVNSDEFRHHQRRLFGEEPASRKSQSERSP